MGLISLSLPSDGSTADVADVNTPLTTIATEINGNLDNTNIKSGAAIDGSKLASGSIGNTQLSTAAGDAGGARLAWTPTITAGVGTFTTTSATGYYSKIGKNIFYEVTVTVTTVGTGSGPIFTLPVAALRSNGYVGSGREDAVNGKMIAVKLATTTTASVGYYDNTAPSTSGMVLRISGHYEAA